MKSYFSNVIYLDIETSGLDPHENEILEIGCIKFIDNDVFEFSSLVKPLKDIPESIFDLCHGLNIHDLKTAPTLHTVLTELKEFIGDYPLICHNGTFEREFLINNFSKAGITFKNDILDTMELFVLLEPYHKEYNLNYFISLYLDKSRFEYHRALEDSKDTLSVLNKILERNNIGDFLYYSAILKDWNWIDKLTHYNLHNELFQDKNNDDSSYELSPKERSYPPLTLTANCEDILKEEDKWQAINSKYKFRAGQYDVMQNVRKTLERDGISIIEAPTGTGKSIAYSLPAIKEALNGKKVFISTNTKELQSQLVNKDIPFLIDVFDLKGKLDYLIIKGKGNYLCAENIKDMLKDEVMKSSLTSREKLGLVFLDRYTFKGQFGDYEDINYWIIDNFSINSLLPHCRCDSDGCDIKHCRHLCFYKDTVEKLKDTNLIILNHSLLLKWPYDAEIEHVIIDEGHNLSDSIYDAYANCLNSKDLISLLLEILDYDKNKGILNFLWKHLRNKQSNGREILRDRIDECKKAIDLIPYHATQGMTSDYNIDKTFDKEYKNYETIKHDLLVLKETLNEFYKTLKLIIDRNNLDESKIKTRGEILIKKCDRVKEYIDFIECFVNESESSKCYGFMCDKNHRFWEAYIKHLNSSSIFFERFLKNTASCSFLSATLKSRGNYNDFKHSLSIEKIEDKFINEVTNIDKTFDLKTRTIISAPVSSFKYTDPGFIDYMVNCTLDLLPKVDGNILVLFNNKKRLLSFKNKILPQLNKLHIRLYDRKKDIEKLKDKSKKSILLGSKGFFEGIDIPGDSLTCVIIDKLPNINPGVPLYEKLISKENNFNIGYTKVNTPRVTTIFKQSFGRLIRTELDYGYFIILDGGTNNHIWTNLKKEYPDVSIIRDTFNRQLNYLPSNYKRWNILNFNRIINDSKEDLRYLLLSNQNKMQDKTWLINALNSFYHEQFENRMVTYRFNLFLRDTKYIESNYTVDNSIVKIDNKIIIKKIIAETYKKR